METDPKQHPGCTQDIYHTYSSKATKVMMTTIGLFFHLLELVLAEPHLLIKE